jgi:hypothetical protein
VAEIFSPDELSRIRRLFGLGDGVDDAELQARLTRSALREYHELFFETGLSSKADEIGQRRCLILMEEVFKSVPSETVLANALRITPSRARSLINAILARFADRVRGLLVRDAIAVLKSVDLKDKNSQPIFIWSDSTAGLIRDEIDKLNFQTRFDKKADVLSTLKPSEGYRRRYVIGTQAARRVLEKLEEEAAASRVEPPR